MGGAEAEQLLPEVSMSSRLLTGVNPPAGTPFRGPPLRDCIDQVAVAVIESDPARLFYALRPSTAARRSIRLFDATGSPPDNSFRWPL